jgi:hypothetical protein
LGSLKGDPLQKPWHEEKANPEIPHKNGAKANPNLSIRGNGKRPIFMVGLYEIF